MTRAKLSRTEKPTWRKELYTTLNAKMGQLKKPEQWVCDQAFEITGHRVESLKDLNNRDLKKLHSVIFSRYKGVGKRKRM